MWKSQLIIPVLLFNCCLYLTAQTEEVFLFDYDINSTTEEFVNSAEDSLPVRSSERLIICLASVTVGTFLVVLTFVLPAMIIMRRAKRDRNRLDLRELRRMSDFM